MTSNNITISNSVCLYEIKVISDDILRPKNKKLGTYENLCEILQTCGVSVTERPDEKVRNIKVIHTK